MTDPARVGSPELDVAPEAAVSLELNGRGVVHWLCTPQRLETLALGWLRGEGVIRGRDEVQELHVRADPPVVRGEVDPRALARLPPERAPGGGRLPVPADVVPEPPRSAPHLETTLADAERLRALFAEMYGRAVLRERGGGVHTGAWVEDGRVVDVAEDVGKANVVDKLVGSSVQEGRPSSGALLLLSGRITATIAAKAWRSGVAAVASLSIPTTLARDLAARAGVTLVGRARGEPQIHRPG